VLNVVYLLGLGAVLIAAVTRMIIGYGFIMNLIMWGMVVSVIGLIVVSNYFKLYLPSRVCFVFVLGNILFPLAFFLLGGSNGAMSAYFVLSIAVIFILTKGIHLIFALTLHLAVIAAVYLAAHFFPELVTPLTPWRQLLDAVQSIAISGLFLGLAFMIHNKMFLREQAKVLDAGRELMKQDTLLRGMNDAAAILLAADNQEKFEKALYNGMKLLANCVDADHVYIWKNQTINGSHFYTRIHSWEIEAENHKIKAATILSFSYEGTFPFWEEKLGRDEIINGPVSSLSEVEITRLTPYGVRSIMVVPVFMQEEFWGFVSFDDCHSERTFTAAEEGILHSGSLLLANAVARNEMTHSLIAAREEALQSSRSKSEFLANMSHEMRTPMNAIIGMTTIAKDSDEVERKDYCLKKIEDASTHLLGVINDILDISKIEANKFELSFENFNFEKLLQKVVNVINFRVEEKQQAFHIDIDRNIPRRLLGDDQRIAQVIANLLSNAVKFTPEEGSIRLTAQLISKENGLCRIKVTVTDTGIGISDEQKPRLFASFEQADSSTSRKFGGTGLGLAISRRIVEMMNGSIWVESEVGKGSSFIFTIEVQEAEGGIQSLLPPGVNWNNLRIMAVDDDPEILSFFDSISGELKIHCETAASGAAALEKIAQNGPCDIYFVDWKMPGMNGIELSKHIIGGGNGNSLKPVVIMFSVVERATLENEAKGVGITKFISKPLFPSSIADCISECMGIEEQTENGDPGAAVDCFAGRRILLAEDVEINREIVLTILEPTTLEIDCAENGAEALRKFSEAPASYDMIFMDIQMPEMDGYEATRRIREFEKELEKSPVGFAEGKTHGHPRERIPIIAMTANVFREDVENCLNAGMDDHVGKPLSFDEVLEKLRKYLK
jgi:signal transduction histidine kinase/DNA-binding response OmpR family regulator